MARIRAVLVRRRFGEDGRMRGKVTAVPTTQAAGGPPGGRVPRCFCHLSTIQVT